MALPDSVDETLTTGSKLPPLLINKMQQCIVGSKFRSTPLYIPHSAFVTLSGAPTRLHNYSAFSSGTPDNLSAPLVLSPGTRITDITWHLGADTTGSLGCYTTRYPDIGIPSETAIDGFSINLTAGWVNANTNTAGVVGPASVLPHVTLAGWYYTLVVGGTQGKLQGVRVTVDRL